MTKVEQTVITAAINNAMAHKDDLLANRAWFVVFRDPDKRQFVAYDSSNPHETVRAITSRHINYKFVGLRGVDSQMTAVEWCKAIRLYNTLLPTLEAYEATYTEALRAEQARIDALKAQ